MTRKHNGAHSTSLASDDVIIPPIVTAHFEDTESEPAVVLATYDEREIREAGLEKLRARQQHESRRRSQGRRLLPLKERRYL